MYINIRKRKKTCYLKQSKLICNEYASKFMACGDEMLTEAVYVSSILIGAGLGCNLFDPIRIICIIKSNTFH